MPQNPPDDYADILLNMEDPEEHGELCEAQQREELPLSTYQVVKTAYYESVQEYFFYSKNPSEKLVTLGKNARLHSIAMRAYAQLSG